MVIPGEQRLWHIALVLVGLLFAFLCVLQHVMQRLDTEYPFRGVEILATDQEFYYAARAREIADGYWTAANAYRSEPKDQPYVQPVLPEWTIVMTGKLFGLDALSAFVFAKVVLGFLTVLAFAAFLLGLSGRRWIVLITLSAVLFAGAILSAPWEIPRLFDSEFSFDFLRFSRPINPLWVAPWTFAALALLMSWWQSRATWKALAIGCIIGILVYSYVYAWTYLGAVLAVLFVVCLVKRDTPRMRDLLFLAGVAALLSIPYLLNTWALIHHPWYLETAQRQGLVFRRDVVIGVWSLVFLAVALVSRPLWPKMFWPVTALALAGILALNQQFITGIHLVPHHYHWYFIQPLASSITLLALLMWLSRPAWIPSWTKRIAFALILIVVLAIGAVHQQRSYNAVRSVWGERQSLAPVFGFLAEHCAPGTVVFASEAALLLRDLVAVETSCDVYSAGNANNFLTPTDRARDSYFFDLWLMGVTAADAKKRFPTDLRYTLSSRLHSIYFRELLGRYDAISDEEVEDNIRRFGVYMALTSAQKLALHPLHYVVRTPSDDAKTAGWREIARIGKPVYDSSGVVVFRLR